MPTYEYHCEGCQENLEIFQSMTADPIEVCPKCGAKKLHRLISGGVGILFKGSGFYCTDYKGHNASTGTSDSHEHSHEHSHETPSAAAKDAKTDKSATTSSADAGKASDKPK